MKALSICPPGRGGMYGVFLTLRKALALCGVDLRWAAAGRSVAEQAFAAASAADFEIGSLVATAADDDQLKARALLDHIEREQPELLFINVFGGPFETNLARYLPRRVSSVLIVHSISRSTYRAARSVRDWIDAAVAVSPRIRQDLIWNEGFRPESVHLIPNAVETDAGLPRPEHRSRELRVLCHGRVEHFAKGVNWLPAILKKALARGLDLTLTVSGEGPDLARLEGEIRRAGLEGHARFLGFVPRERVPEVMRAHDVLLFPSVFEGFGLTLLEAMAAGCVPVASRIRGVTDYVVADGETGLLFPVGSTRAAAARLVELENDRQRLQAMSERAGRSVRARFGIEAQGAAFLRLIETIHREPRRARAALPVERWQMPSELRPGWWHALPAPVKSVLRVTRERLQFGHA